MKVRVIRILEYEYVDEEHYMQDRTKWSHGFKTHNMTMKSAVLPVDLLGLEGTEGTELSVE